MAHTFKISSLGLKLIKAYEGFRPIETTLVSGQRVIGYGHRYHDDEEPAITRKKAEDVLKTDVSAYEALVNENTFAPLSQSQFDALVSLSFNIGPRAFLSSSVLHALNNGRPLEAAAGFDEWRKSVIDGKTYVVDALVRRRTAEKSLFLRASEGVVSAPRHEVPPQRDQGVTVQDMNLATFDKADAHGLMADVDTKEQGFVDQAPYAKAPEYKRRREDGPTGIFSHSEVEVAAIEDAPADNVEDIADTLSATLADTPADKLENIVADGVETVELDVKEDVQPKKPLSPIALAAEEVSERLDRLIADSPDVIETETPISVIEEKITEPVSTHTPEKAKDIAEVIANIKAANEGTHEDYRRPAQKSAAHVRSPDAYIQKPEKRAIEVKKQGGLGAYWASLIVGTTLLASGATKWFLSPQNTLDDVSAFIVPVATVIGAMLVLGSLYYMAKTLARRP